MHVFLNFLLPRIEHFGVWSYWFIFLIVFLESLVFVGILVPGSVILIFMGFLAGKGVLDLDGLFWFALCGAIIGDGVSFYLGKSGLNFFGGYRAKVLHEDHVLRGEAFFTKHGGKSIFFARFVGLLRPIIPFVAGVCKMENKKFFSWNIFSAMCWAGVHVLVGYYFGQYWWLLERWVSRGGKLVFVLALFAIMLYIFKRSLIRIGRQFFAFCGALFRAISESIANRPAVVRWSQKHVRAVAWLRRRFTRHSFAGLSFTLFSVASLCVLVLFFGMAEDVLRSGSIVGTDHRLAYLLYTYRDPVLVKFFLLVTWAGESYVVLAGVLAAALYFWLWRRREYIVPFAVTIAGSAAFTFLSKLIVHRARPMDIAVYQESSFSFPSGHATLAVAFWGFLLYIALREWKSWPMKVNAFFMVLGIIFAIGFSRLYLGVHFLSDVFGGYLVGSLGLIIGIMITEWRRSRRSPAVGS